MKLPKSKYFLGVYGERIVHENLPGSIWMRLGNGMGRDPFDIKWNELKIEVKSSRSFYGDENNFYMQFSLLRNEADVFVFVGVKSEKLIYFWVKSKKEFHSSVYLKKHDSFTNLSDIPKEIQKSLKRVNKDAQLAYGK